MSLPPIDPDKSTSGIIVDPRTLERVVPSSRRKDGTTRKELKIRPGFTPQEDIGLYRSSRQQSTPSKPSVPGSSRPVPPPSQKSTENPFAQPAAAKTKAQLKNEKRRERKRTEGTKAWDEDSSEEEDDLRGAFEKVDLAHRTDKPLQGAPTEETYPEAGGGGGAPAPGVVQEVVASTSQIKGSGPVSILEPAAGPDGPESGSQLPDAPAPASAKPSNPVKPKTKPHPIQGGRQGPIGLAFPPPIEAPKRAPAPSSRADEVDTWRQAKPREQRQNQVPVQSRGPKSGASRPPRAAPGSQAPQTSGEKAGKSLPPKPSAPEPRVRKEVRVKQGGANDLSSLASRVKNLVLDSATPRKAVGGASARTAKETTSTS